MVRAAGAFALIPVIIFPLLLPGLGAENSSQFSAIEGINQYGSSGEDGGPDCMSCHDIEVSNNSGKLVNFTAMNETSSIHKNLNNGTSTSLPAANKKCWACHGNAVEPGTEHPSNYKTPYRCQDCHILQNAHNTQLRADFKCLVCHWVIKSVNQHYFNGTSIATPAAISCYLCHNKSEMLIYANDPDNGTGAVYGGENGGNSSPSHYGKKRTDIRVGGSTNCSYCHQNTSTAFENAMFDPIYNSSIQNHSLHQNSPSCIDSNCHKSGLLHDINLAMPVFTVTNTFSFCQNCHTGKQKHNGTQDCSRCHIDQSSDDTIHPIKYMQIDESFITSNTSAVNCASCHQGAGLSAFSSAQKIPGTLKHSSSIYNGSLWNITGEPFWTSEITSCYYCHDDTRHNYSSALGKIYDLTADMNNTRKGNLTTTAWCADCHLNTSNNKYIGSLWTPTPPLITIDNTGKRSWINHSTYFGSGFKDSTCLACHAQNNTSLEVTPENYSHSLNEGVSGDPDCLQCHNLASGLSGGAPTGINFTASSLSVHNGTNSENATSRGYAPVVGSCWACHDSDGNVTSGHPDRYKNPKTCIECHLGSGEYNSSSYNAAIVAQHCFGGTSIVAGKASSVLGSCINCHENISEMVLYNNDNDLAGSFNGDGLRLAGGNMSFYHYGKSRTDLRTGTSSNCSYCHQNTSTAFNIAMVDPAYNSSIQNHSASFSSPSCFNSGCHNSGWIHNSTLIKPAFTFPNSSFCISCHPTEEKHNGSTGLDCTRCHLNTSQSIHPVQYLQNDGISWSTFSSNAVNCTTCHQRLLSNFSTAKQVPELEHSGDPYSGQKWGNYWINTSTVRACYYCHQNQVHLAAGLLGNITLIKGSNSYNNPDIANSTWCVNCHYSRATYYNGTVLNPVPPDITDSSITSTDGTDFYDHSNFTGYNDSICMDCHGAELSGYLGTTLNFSHRVSEGGGGADCISCHEESRTGAPSNLRISLSSMNSAVHKNLNSDAVNSTAIYPVDKACWACHGNGTEPSGHPLNYSNPRRCSNNDCHSLVQSYKAPMIYSHFKDAELNDNQNRVLNYNVTTVNSCETCHSNSMSTTGDNLNASVSHYATRDKLIDSINCMYCHLDRDNAQTWGDAIKINKNRTSIIEMNRDIHERNKFTAHEGDFVELGLGYRLKVLDFSKQRGSASIELYHYNTLVDKGLVNIGQYIYEEKVTVDNDVFTTPIIILNFSEMFLADNDAFIQFEGWRINRLHTENKTTSCYLCHYAVGNERHKYRVIDKINEKIYFIEVLFDSSDIQEYDEQQALKTLSGMMPNDSFTDIGRSIRKSIYEGETWNIGKDVRLTLKDISTNSDSALFLLEIGNKTYQDVVRTGGILEYEINVNYPGQKHNNITIFRAKVPEMHQNKPDMVVLTEILALSPEIRSAGDNMSIYGYNASWLWENNTFSTGRIPSSMHAPLLHDGVDGGPDCISCHIGIELGFHKLVNKDAKSSVAEENKACWACHGDGKEPLRHPVSYKQPRNCRSCHVERGITFNATHIGDEKHNTLENCAQCHAENTHKIFRFNVVPGIRDMSISKEEIAEGEKISIHATAVAGFNMKIKGAVYHIDSSDETFSMSSLDGSFDEQVEEIIAEIDTNGLNSGTHLISLKAMELNNKWGVESSMPFTVMERESTVTVVNKFLDYAIIEPEEVPYLAIALIATFTIALWFILKLLIIR
jgi:hypothetical protein